MLAKVQTNPIINKTEAPLIPPEVKFNDIEPLGAKIE
jgi:hypothetical protein